MRKLGFHTRAARGLAPVDQETGALTIPIYQTASFAFEYGEAGKEIISGEREGYFYSRFGNPTTRAFERDLAALEGGEDALAFSSGMAAISMLILAHCGAGDHLVAQRRLYGGTAIFVAGELKRFGVEVTYVEEPDPDSIRDAIRPNTKLVYLETPSNPLLHIIDIAACARAARDAGLPVAFDNTFCTPYLQRPLELGATYSLHSATKFFAGHDVVGGALVGPAESIRRIRHTIYKDLGPAPMPMASYLFQRGLKTLPLRLDRHCDNALAFASFLRNHPKVGRVYYPGLPTHPGFELARKQMLKFGTVLAFELAGMEEAGRFVRALELCVFAVSLGDALTLVQHPPGVTHGVFDAEKAAGAGMSPGFIRIAAGLEDPEDIIADIAQALDKV